MRTALYLPVILLMPLAACARQDPGFVTPGMPAPNCDGIEHPEENPSCPEWVAPWQKPMQPARLSTSRGTRGGNVTR